MDEELDDVVFNIRAIIQSNQYGTAVTIRDLARDYNQLVSSPIPYRQFNYETIEDFLRSLPSVRVSGSGPQARVEVAASSESRHVTDLISKQKSHRKPAPPPPRRSYYGPSFRGRGGRGRGSYPPRPYVPRFWDDSASSRDYPSRDPPARSYPAEDQHSRDYNNSLPKRYSPSFQNRPASLGGKPITVKVDADDKRQVSYKKPDLPPRFQKLKENESTDISRSSSISPGSRTTNSVSQATNSVSQATSLDSQGFESNLFMGHSDSTSDSDIISALGPSQLIAAGRAKKQADLAKLGQNVDQDFFVERPSLLLQPSNSEPNNLVENFARLSYQHSLGAGDMALENRVSVNGHNRVAENWSRPMLKVPQPEDILPNPDDADIRNNVNILLSYCLSRGWPVPVYHQFKRKCMETHKTFFFFKVTVQGEGPFNFKLSSFSHEHENPVYAQGYAAKLAIKKIVEEASKVKDDDKTISSDTQIICKRINDIVAGATAGKFSSAVAHEYVEKYEELLPEDWLQKVSSWPTLSVESNLNNLIIFPSAGPQEVSYKKPDIPPRFQKLKENESTDIIRSPSISPGSQTTNSVSQDTSLDSQQVRYDPMVAPPPLPIEVLGTNDDGIEDVYITHATSVSNVFFRVIGDYSDQYDELLSQMDEYYNGIGEQELAIVLEVGHYYAAHNSNTWFRVRVTEVHDDSKTVVAWLIDLGGSEIFPFGSLFRLAPKFCELPQQAVQCTLEGLESFNEDEVTNEVVSDLRDRTLIAKITNKDLDSRLLTAILYDTSGEEDVEVNGVIEDEITVLKAKPVLRPEGGVGPITIGDVSKKGEIYFSFPGRSFDRIQETLESLGPEKISEHKLTSFKHISLNKMYLAKYSKDDTWYRAVVIATPSVQHNKIPVRFVDYGNTESVSISDIADLENLPSILRKLPPQAIKVALSNLPIETLTNNEIAKLHSWLLSDEEKVILSRTVSLKSDPPTVEIFTKDADNLFVSVNMTMEQDRIEENKLEHNSLDAISTSNQDVFDLKCPDLSTSDYEIVLVVLAAHPTNFVFQPGKYSKELKKLQEQLTAYYDAGVLPEVPAHRVEKNKLFAARHLDDMWYRVLVTGTPMGSRVPVRLCDYGDITCLPISNLRELAQQFHVCPFMAIKGKLAGVAPLHSDWSVEDTIRFQSLVLEQVRYAKIVDIHKDESPMEVVMTLRLIDTSSDEDRDFADILVQENRAVRVG